MQGCQACFRNREKKIAATVAAQLVYRFWQPKGSLCSQWRHLTIRIVIGYGPCLCGQGVHIMEDKVVIVWTSQKGNSGVEQHTPVEAQCTGLLQHKDAEISALCLQNAVDSACTWTVCCKNPLGCKSVYLCLRLMPWAWANNTKFFYEFYKESDGGGCNYRLIGFRI